MDSKEIYIKQFQDILSTEIMFSKQYKDFMEMLNDKSLIKELSEIYNDENRHVEIARELVRMISEEP